VDDLLKRDEIGIEAAQLAVDDFNSPGIALVIPHVQVHHSYPHDHRPAFARRIG
jgi:hypothetical protein